MPRISIILPTFNSAVTLQATIDSVLNQTFPDFELLIIDNGSTDDTVALARANEDSRVKVQVYANAGVGRSSASRNRGLSMATGEYIAFINDRDLWSAEKLSAQLAALEATPSAMVAYSWIDHIRVDGSFAHQGSRIDTSGHVLHDLLRGNFIETPSNPLIRSEAFKAVGAFNSSFRLVADWEMWLRIAMQYHFVCIPEVHVSFRESPDLLSAETRRMERDALRLFSYMYSILPFANEFRVETYGNFYEYLASRSLKGDPSALKAKEGLSFLREGLRYNPQLAWRKRRRVVSIAAKAAAFKRLPTRHIEAGLQVYRKHYV